eukprot:CAMPEP_0119288648 /NCGR_PEP_ID=MMETSP1329-20130426/37642_1 /TAXON_ID=114041 /ORGANISM="Genus nov. species nov., Strain RCC1024" /LENGTH=103 /DNA_ID=CAMNT_0007289431 /DNA_START=145 /DNA_END=453 /DNA_ORIENTATION=+
MVASQRLQVAAAAALAAAAIAWWRRRCRPEYQYVVEAASLAGAGKLVFLQRHGRTSKNVLLKKQKDQLKKELKAAMASGGDAASIVARYHAVSNEARWFDDCL